MKTLLLGSTILSFVLFFSGESNSQKLAQPIPNKVAQKQAVSKSENSNVSTSTKSGLSKKNEQTSNTNTQSQVEASSKEKPNLATKDADDYQAKKLKWIAENPEKYKEMSGNPRLVIMTEAEFKLLSKEEQSKVLADPDNYFIIQ